jgi:hypothetical protein
MEKDMNGLTQEQMDFGVSDLPLFSGTAVRVPSPTAATPTPAVAQGEFPQLQREGQEDSNEAE